MVRLPVLVGRSARLPITPARWRSTTKPGYDPCELFFDPRFRVPKLRAARRLLQKKLGFRTVFDLTPLDATIVKGSHGLVAADPQDAAILVGHGPRPDGGRVPMTAVKELVLGALGLGE